MRGTIGRIFLFPEIICVYHNRPNEAQFSCRCSFSLSRLANSKFTIMFPIDDVKGLKEKIDASPRKGELFMLYLPSIRVAS